MRVRSLTVFALVSAAASQPLAQTASPLTWTAPRGCPTRDEVLARARDAGLRDDAGEWTATATVRHVPGGAWRLQMIISASGDAVPTTRSAPRCADLAQLAGVDLALVINAHVDPPPPPPRPPPPAQPPPPPPQPPAPTPSPAGRDAEPVGPPRAPSASPGRRWNLDVDALLLTDFGALPTGNVGVGLSFAIAWSFASLGLSAAYFAPLGTDSGGGLFQRHAEGFADVGAWTASARGCGRLAWRALSVDGCLGVEVGARTARGALGINDATEQRDLWVGPLASVEGAWRPWRWMRVSLGVDGAIPLPALPWVRVENYGVVLDSWGARVVPRIGLGVAL